MTSWQGAWTLLRFEGRRSWIGLLITMAFFTYVSVFLVPLFGEMLDQEKTGGYAWFQDFMYLTILPTMGFLMNRNFMHYWSRDPYTRKLAYWRTLPISWNAIVIARYLQHAIVLTIVSAYFFSLQYALLSDMRELLSPGEYVGYALIWYGYALMAGATYVYFEQTVSGKVYFAVCAGYVLVYAAIIVVLGLTDTRVVVRTMDASRHHEWLWPVLSVALGAAVILLMGLLLRRRLAKRNLLF
jgi:hypothetical protein